jgi:hypothetical protein
MVAGADEGTGQTVLAVASYEALLFLNRKART